MLPFYLAFAAVLFPFPAAGQSQTFTVESEVAFRADSFACKDTSELDRLLQRNQSGGFTSGTQLYDYLKANKCIGLTAGHARVYSTRGQYVCIYDLKDNKTGIYPCAWTRTDAVEISHQPKELKVDRRHQGAAIGRSPVQKRKSAHPKRMAEYKGAREVQLAIG